MGRRVARERVALHRRRKLPRARRRVFIDCGANTCAVLRTFIARFPDFEFFAFEPQPDLRQDGERLIRELPDTRIVFFNEAVWVRDEEVPFFLATKWGPNYRGSSTLLHGHTSNAVDYSAPVRVTAIDFSRWLSKNFTSEDYVIVKMDIEGAEYPVLEKLLSDGRLSTIDELIIEFHRRQNQQISEERHKRLVSALRRSTLVTEWH